MRDFINGFKDAFVVLSDMGRFEIGALSACVTIGGIVTLSLYFTVKIFT